MQKAQKSKVVSAPPWVLRTLAGFVLVFAGFAVFQLVSAQTSTQFKDPSCDPLSAPGDCSPGGPLLLTAGTKQTLESDIDLGKTGATKNLGIYGNITLNTGTGFASKLITPVGGIGGNPINIESALVNSILADNAIVGKTTAASGKAGIYGIATNAAAYGVYAINTANTTASYALFADGGSTGNAAQFTGKLKFMLAADPTNKYATLALDANGNLDFGINTAGKGLTVNGSPIASAGVQKAKTFAVATGAIGSTNDYDVKQHFLNYSQYEVTSIQVLYDDTGTTDIQWIPLPTYTYRECTGTSFEGQLALTKPIANAVNYRIIVTYDPQSTLPCTTGPAPTSVTINGTNASYGLQSSWWYEGTIINLNSIATDGTGSVGSGANITKIEFYSGNTLLNPGNTGTSCVLNGANTENKLCTYTWNLNLDTVIPSSYSGGPSLSIYAKAYTAGGSLASTTMTPILTLRTTDNRIPCGPNTCDQLVTGMVCCNGTGRHKWVNAVCSSDTNGSDKQCNAPPPLDLNDNGRCDAVGTGCASAGAILNSSGRCGACPST